MKRVLMAVVLILALLVAGCQQGENGAPAEGESLILATTTSTYDSGLLDYLLPEFEEANNIEVDVIAVGTGQAIEIGKSGDCDIILVHARELEDQFVAEGYGTQRWDVMYNDYVYLGPKGTAEINRQRQPEGSPGSHGRVYGGGRHQFCLPRRQFRDPHQGKEPGPSWKAGTWRGRLVPLHRPGHGGYPGGSQ